MGKVIGIDLGTTNSCVSVVENNVPVIIPCSTGGQTTPSVAAFTKKGERLVGAAARRQPPIRTGRSVQSRDIWEPTGPCGSMGRIITRR